MRGASLREQCLFELVAVPHMLPGGRLSGNSAVRCQSRVSRGRPELQRSNERRGARMTYSKNSRSRLFFASQSIEDPRVTNLLQVRHMVAAFSRYCDVTVVV